MCSLWEFILVLKRKSQTMTTSKVPSARIFIVEDDPVFARLIERQLSLNPDFEVECFTNGASIKKAMVKQPDVVTLDIRLPDTNGLELLQELKTISPETQFIALSSQEDIEVAVAIVLQGAFDYIVKNKNALSKIWNQVHLALSTTKRRTRPTVTTPTFQRSISKNMIGTSKKMRTVYGLIEKASQSTITVSIAGETGTGKELAAKAIHENSTRRNEAFVAVNVAAIPSELIESELFGHEKGAFTGAEKLRIGKFEEAKNGTLFLDEITEMSPAMQAKLLRVLQEKEISRIGSNKLIPIHIRLIIATHADLFQEVQKGNFREDLYYRLLGLTIHLPPLAERGNDIVLLANHFLRIECQEQDLPQKQFSQEALHQLKNYHFPGNIRELKALIELAVITSESTIIEVDDLGLNNKMDFKMLMKTENKLDQYMVQIIHWHLKQNQNNVVKTAQKLGVGKSTIYRLIKSGQLKN
jgi:two-component system response regulator AtoC